MAVHSGGTYTGPASAMPSSSSSGTRAGVAVHSQHPYQHCQQQQPLPHTEYTAEYPPHAAHSSMAASAQTSYAGQQLTTTAQYPPAVTGVYPCDSSVSSSAPVPYPPPSHQQSASHQLQSAYQPQQRHDASVLAYPNVGSAGQSNSGDLSRKELRSVPRELRELLQGGVQVLDVHQADLTRRSWHEMQQAESAQLAPATSMFAGTAVRETGKLAKHKHQLSALVADAAAKERAVIERRSHSIASKNAVRKRYGF
jgi:Mitotic checkpoint regulator, MAD2B-interacting